MKLELELPDWAVGENKSLLLTSDGELVAVRKPGEKWKVKKTRCNQCGECCLDVFNLTPFGGDDEGKCNALKKEGDKWVCTAGGNKPIRCLHDPLKTNVPGCSIEYED